MRADAEASSMVTTCFSCQNLLSDYSEGMLPASRHDELKTHLSGCKNCTSVHEDLEATLSVLKALPSNELSHDMALRITEASAAGRTHFISSVRVSRTVLFLSIPVLLFFGAASAFPSLFPWYTRWRSGADSANFIRYYPLMQGGAEIVDEHANWLRVRESFTHSMWEEGGMSPDEFEKAFQFAHLVAKGNEDAAAAAAKIPDGKVMPSEDSGDD